MKDKEISEAMPKRVIALIFVDVIWRLDVLIQQTAPDSIYNSDIDKLRLSICDKIIYLMDVMHYDMSVSSHMYALYGIWLKKVITLKNLSDVRDDMEKIKNLLK